ncbi:Ger(x)C family spore germination protein [Bacillus sp. 2205SS5-2]|uniref:Ger(x)C family spore germination protein n=1 Tax=Bacillus sp. 2205SS5-2 TaxID=3109031 RepID=UPI003007743D
MKASRIILSLLISVIFLLSGCWDQNELPVYGFVQAVSIDLSEEDENKLVLTTQFIKPSPKISSSGNSSGEAYINVQTEGDSTFEAIRDITNHLGRKAQWSHTRIILLSEELVKKRELGELLEFFYRDHEPRLLMNLAVTQGRSQDYLNVQPFIENTISQQLKEIERIAQKFSAKTVEATLLTLGTELKSELKTGTIPYFTMGTHQHPVVSGISMFQKGKMVDTLSPIESEGLLMLTNRYNSGIIEIPCKTSDRELIETVEVMGVTSKSKFKLNNNKLSFDESLTIEASIGELKCTSLDNSEALSEFNKIVEKEVKKNLLDTINRLQEDKIDALGIGNDVYRQQPDLWGEIKDQWPSIFGSASYTIKVKVNTMNSSSDVGKPFFLE